MAELLVVGIGGMLLGGGMLLNCVTSGRSYVDQLKSAHPVSATSADQEFVYVSGNLEADSYGPSAVYVALWQKRYELAVVKEHRENENQKTQSMYRTQKLLMSTNFFVSPNIMIGGWNVSDFLPSFKVVSAGEIFDPVAESSSRTNSPEVSINIKSKAADIPLGEVDRRVTGVLTVSEGVKSGDYYTIFGVNAKARQSNTIQPCPVNGRLVFHNKTASQVIQEAEKSLSTWMWTSVALGCVSGVVTAFGAVANHTRQ